jgi:hypothetical protein
VIISISSSECFYFTCIHSQTHHSADFICVTTQRRPVSAQDLAHRLRYPSCSTVLIFVHVNIRMMETDFPMDLGIYQPPGAISPDDVTITSTKRKRTPVPAEEEQTNEEGEAGNHMDNALKHRRVEDTCSAREVAMRQQNCECCSCKLLNGACLCHTCKRWAHWDCSMGCLTCTRWHCVDCWAWYTGLCPTCHPDYKVEGGAEVLP